MSSMGALVVEVQGNASRTQEDMGRIVDVVDAAARRINASAGRASNSIDGIGRAGRNIGRVKGAEQAAESLNKVEHSAVGARREMMVLAHELATGNIKRAAGSFMVLGERMDFMGKLMSPTGLAIGALVAVVGGLAVAAYKGVEAHNAFNKAVIASGNYAGVTEDRFNSMALAVQSSTNATLKEATDITRGLVETGRVGPMALQHVATAAALMANITGKSSEDVIKDFSKMSEGALKWAVEADKQYHFLTGALFDQIKALEDANENEKAMIVVADAVVAAKKHEADALGETHSALQLFNSDLEDTISTIGKFLSGTQTIGDRITGIKAALAQNATVAQGFGGSLADRANPGARRAQLMGQLGASVSVKRRQEDDADRQAFQKNEEEKTVIAKTQWAERMKAHHESVDQMNKDIEDAKSEGARAGAPQAEIDKEVARIKKDYADKGASGVQHADTLNAMQPLQAQISAEEKLLAYRERVLEQYHKADLISDKGYYETKRTVIEAATKRLESLYDQEIAVADNQVKRATDARAKIEATTKANELRDAKAAALLQTGEELSSIDLQQAQSAETYREEVVKLTAELDKLNHTQSNSAGADFDRAHSALRKQATVSGDSQTLTLLDSAKAATEAQTQINNLKEKGQLIEAGLTTAEKQNQLLTQTGQQTEIEGMLKIDALRAASLDQLRAIAAQMQSVATASGLPELATQANQFKLSVDQVQASSNTLGKTVSDVFASNFSKSLLEVQNRTKSLKQAFMDMAQGIEEALLRIVDNDVAQMLFGSGAGSIGGASSGGGAGVATSLFGKLIGVAMTAFGGGAPADSVTSDALSAPDWGSMSGRASGGPVARGQFYQVNERDPELFTVANKTYLMAGAGGGHVTPMGGGARNPVFNMNISVPAGTSRQSATQQASEIMRHAQIAQGRNG